MGGWSKEAEFFHLRGESQGGPPPTLVISPRHAAAEHLAGGVPVGKGRKAKCLKSQMLKLEGPRPDLGAKQGCVQSPAGLPSCTVKSWPRPVGRELCAHSPRLPWLVSTCLACDRRAPCDPRLGAPTFYQRCCGGTGVMEWHSDLQWAGGSLTGGT